MRAISVAVVSRKKGEHPHHGLGRKPVFSWSEKLECSVPNLYASDWERAASHNSFPGKSSKYEKKLPLLLSRV